MANDPNAILKEYLVSIGFDVDRTALQATESKIGGFMEGIAGMAGTAIKALGAVVTTVAVIDERLRNLHFEEIRTGSSVANIHALDSAIKSLGGSTASVMGSLSVLNAARHGQNFQAQAWTGALGLDMSGDTTKEYLSALPKLAKMLANNDPLAGVYASGLGISMDTLYAYNNAPDKENFLKNYGAVADAAGKVDTSGIAQRGTNVLSSADRKLGLGEISGAVGIADPANRAALALDNGVVGKTTDKVLGGAPVAISHAIEGLKQAGQAFKSGFRSTNGTDWNAVMADHYHRMAETVAAMTGGDPALIFAQWQHETNGFKHMGGSHNYGGLGYNDKTKKYANYASDDEFVIADAKQLRTNGRDPIKGVHDAATYAHILKAGGYYSDAESTYANGMKNALKHPTVIFNQETKIILQGGGGSKKDADAVADAQTNTNKLLVTNLQGATQ